LHKAINEKNKGVFSSDLYHLTTSGSSSWHDFAKEIVDVANHKLNLGLKIINIIAIPTKEYPTPAQRPMNSQLVLTKLEGTFGIEMPHWRKALELCIEEIK
jgi:dTDP-4-dehydrorhamnose reductase